MNNTPDFTSWLGALQTDFLQRFFASMENFFLAGSLLQVRNLHFLPETFPPITSEKLEQIIIPLVNRLVDSARPPS